MKHMYVADDGKTFENETECVRHEASLEDERRKRMKQSAADVSETASQMAEYIGALITKFLEEYPGGEAELFPLLEKKAPNLMLGIRLVAFFAG